MTIAVDASPMIVIALCSTAVLITVVVVCYLDARNRCNEWKERR